jgi:hypothetical protein
MSWLEGVLIAVEQVDASFDRSDVEALRDLAGTLRDDCASSAPQVQRLAHLWHHADLCHAWAS